MHENNYKNFVEFLKKILYKIKPKFSFHYVAYTTLFVLVIFSVVQLVQATTPNPGHPWSELGDGVFVFTNSQTTTPRTYTFPDANATVLTTNSAVTVAQGGTGITSIADGDLLVTTGANTFGTLTIGAGQSLRRNSGGTAFEAFTPSTGTVTGVSVVSANGFAGSATSGAIPAITISTSVSGMLKGNGTAISAATDGTDFLSPSTGWKLDGQTLGAKKTLGSIDAYDIGFLTNNSERMTILSSGNIGIGTTNPTSGFKLDVAGNIIIGSGNQSSYLFLNDDNGRDWGVASGLAGNGLFSVYDITGATNPLVINSSGNVGIGTTSPGKKLTIQGDGVGHASSASGQFEITGTTEPLNKISFGIADNANDSTTYGYIFAAKQGISYRNLILNGLGGNVGIGTTAPSVNLHVKNNDAVSASGQEALRIEASYNSGTVGSGGSLGFYTTTPTKVGSIRSYMEDANNIGLLFSAYSNGMGDKMYIKGNGNIGMGTTSPVSALHVNNASPYLTISSTDTILSADENVGSLVFYSNDASANSSGGVGAIRSFVTSEYNTANTPSYMAFYTHANSTGPNGSVVGGAGLLERMRIDSAGNVGIGTTNLGTKLSIYDNTSPIISLGGSGTNQAISGAVDLLENIPSVLFGTSGQYGFRILNDGVNNLLKIQSGNDTTVNDRLVIARGTGNVGIGTTTPSYALHVVGTVGATNGIFSTDGYFGAFKPYGSGNDLIFKNNGGTELFRIKDSGAVGIGTTTPTAILHLKAGTATASTAPLKFTSGTNLITPEAGAMEYDGSRLYFTPSSTRETLAFTSDLTSGYIPYTGGTSNVDLGIHNLTVDTTTLFVDATNHRVGVGTTTPGNQLHVVRNVTNDFSPTLLRLQSVGSTSSAFLQIDRTSVARMAGINYSLSGTTEWFTGTYYNSGSGQTSFGIGTNYDISNQKLVINTSGNVGIGTTNPGERLQIGNYTSDEKLIVAGVDGSVSGATIMWAEQNATTGILSVYDSTNNQLHFNSDLKTDILRLDRATGRVVMNAGNVGIGTTTPNALLDVGGSSQINAAIYPRIGITSNADRIESLQLQNINAGSSAEMRFVAAANDNTYLAFTQPSSGNTSTSFFGVAKSSGSFIFNSANGGTARDMYIGTLDAKSLNFGTNNTTRIAITSTGNVGIGTTTPTAILHLKAGTATASTAPLKFTSGTNLTTPEAGAMEYDGTNLYFTPSGTTRKTIAYVSDLTSGYIPYTGGTSNVDLGIHNLTVDTTTLFVDATNHKVGIGTTSFYTNVKSLQVTGAKNNTNVGIVGVMDSTSFATGVGGRIILGGKYNTAGTEILFAGIEGIKENSTDGNYAGALVLSSVPNGGNLTERMRISSSGYVGIGTTTPLTPLDVYGSARIGKGFDAPVKTLTLTGNLNFDTVANPTNAQVQGMVLTNAGAGNIEAGKYYYTVMFTTAEGDTGAAGITSSAQPNITLATPSQVSITNIPVSTDPRVTSRKIYRSQAGTDGDYYYLYYIGTIADNTTTTYTDNSARSTASTDWFYNKNNTTSGIIYRDGSVFGRLGDYITAFGNGAFASLAKGSTGAAFGSSALVNNTTGDSNQAFGHASLSSVTTGSNNVAMGYASGQGNQTGGNNVSIGNNALRNNSTQSYSWNTAIGAEALGSLTANNNYNIGIGGYAGGRSQGNYGIYIGHQAGFIPTAGTVGDNNIAIGTYSGQNFSTGGYNVVIGYNVQPVTPTSSNQLNIGNLIYGTGLAAGSTPATSGKIGIGLTTPTAILHLKAGTATASTAPLKFTSGTNLTTPEAGAMEYDGTNLYFTPSGTTRKTIAYVSDLTSGYIPYTGGTSNVDLGIHNLTVDTTTLFVDATNHRVGVGTTTPDMQFTVKKTLSDAHWNAMNIAYVGSWSTAQNKHANLIFGNSDTTSTGNPIAAIGVTYGSAGYGRMDFHSFYNGGFKTDDDILMSINGNGYVGIGTTAPTYKLDVKGVAVADGIRSDMGFDIYPVPDPTAPTGVVSSGGSVDTGYHYYAVTYYTAVGETHSVFSGQITTTAGNNTVTLTIPVSTDPRVVGRKIYRTKAGAYQWNDYLLATVANNTSTSYVDSVADSTLSGSSGASYFKTNTTSKQVTVGGTRGMIIDSKATYFGLNAGLSVTTGGRNSFFGTGAGQSNTSGTDNNFFGYSSGSATTTGGANVGMGYAAMGSNTSGSNNTAVGHDALLYNQTGSNNTAVGYLSLFGVSGNSASYNTGLGYGSGASVTSGGYNTFLGSNTAYNLSTGTYNLFAGYQAGRYISGGSVANTTGANSVFLGSETKPLADGDTNEIVIGYNTTGIGSNSVTLGNDSITKTALKGNVGIGTTTPSYKLDVSGDIRSGITGTAGRFLLGRSADGAVHASLSSTGSGAIELSQSGGTASKQIMDATGIRFQTFDGAALADRMTILQTSGNVGIGITTPTAYLNIKAGTAVAGTAPLKFTSGTNLTTPEAGAMEYDGTELYFTPSGTTRETIAYMSDFPITIVNSSNLFSTKLSGTGSGVTATTDSIFLGVDAGNGATGANNSNFLGLSAGKNASGATYANFFGSSAGEGATGASYSNFLGQNSGLNATDASYANFIGPSAGNGATNASNSNFFGYNSGNSASYASSSNFFGASAGSGATYANDSTFIGYQAGLNGTYAANSNFIGGYAGSGATSATYSNFLGSSAGSGATDSTYANFIGYQAGLNATTAGSSNFIGKDAGNGALRANNSNFFGESAGSGAVDATYSNFSGISAGYGATDAHNANFFGQNSGNLASGANNSNFFGQNAGDGATSASYSNFLGKSSGISATDASYSNFIGHYSGYTASSAANSNFIGYYAGSSATTASNSIFIGKKAGFNDTVDNTASANNWSILIGYNTRTGGYGNSILLGGSSSTTAITNTKANQFMLADTITDVRWRGVEYTLPSAQGVANSIISNNGSGTLSWTDTPTLTSLTTPLIIGGTSTTSSLTLKTTTGVGTTGADMHFLVGNNGATEAMTILNNGKVGIGTTAPSSALNIKTNQIGTGVSLLKLDNSGTSDNEVGIDFYTSGTGSTSAMRVGRIYGFSNSSSYGNGRLVFQSVLNGGVLGYTMSIHNNNVGIGTLSPTAKLDITPSSSTSGSQKGIVYTGASNTGQTASTEIPSVTFTTTGRQWATGAIATQREFLITAPTYSFVGASTITNSATVGINGAPIQSTNATLTNTHALLIQSGAVGTATNSYGLTVNTQTGATNNYAASFLGGNVGIGTTSPATQLNLYNASTGSTDRISISENANWSDGEYNLIRWDNGGTGYQMGRVGVGLSGSYARFVVRDLYSSGYQSNRDMFVVTGDYKVGIGTSAPTNMLSLNGTAARTIWMERNTTAATAGQGLTLSSGGAIAGTADLAGGDLIFKSGISTGTGTSALRFFTATAGSSGSTDNTPTEKMTILGSGNVGIGTTTPGTQLEITNNFTLPTTVYNAGLPYGIIYKGTNRFIHNFNYGLNGNGVTTEGNNTFIGVNSGNLTMGSTATYSYYSSNNTGVGYEVLKLNATGRENTAIGSQSLENNTDGTENTAIGSDTLWASSVGTTNVAIGSKSLASNTSGSVNTAVGAYSLNRSQTAWYNTSLGYRGGYSATGGYNTFLGANTAHNLTTGTYNLFAGYQAGRYISGGSVANTTGANSVFLGSETKPLADGDTNEIVIGYNTTGIGSNSVTLGNDSITKTALKGNVGIGLTSPTAYLNIKAGTATASTAPLKFTSGTNLTTAEAGAMEYDGTELYFTPSGTTRETIAYMSDFPITIVNSSNLFSTKLSGTGSGVTATTDSIFLGVNAGYGATSASSSNFIGPSAGFGATNAAYSNFFGYESGYEAINASSSNFIGPSAGFGATNAAYSNFFGSSAGEGATGASYSNFLGQNSGLNATDASYANFFGQGAGAVATSASYSNLFGYHSGATFTGNNIGSNNIIIGTNISLPNATANAINLGGVLFATGTYATTTGDPSITAASDGKVGIGIVSPTAYLNIKAGTATASTAPLKFTSGTNLTTPEAGAMEYDGSRLYFTPSSTRETLAFRSEVVSKIVNTSFDNESAVLYSYAHGTVQKGDIMFVGTRGNPATLTRFNDPNDLSDYDQITLTGYKNLESLVYDSVNDKLYGYLFTTVGYLTIVEIDPDTLSWSIVLDTNSIDGGDTAGITTDGTYVYVVTYTNPAIFVKIRISDWTIVAQNTWTNGDRGHAIGILEFSDRTELYATSSGSSAYFAKIDPDDLSYSEVALDIGFITDDLCFDKINDDYAYVYVGSEYADTIVNPDNKMARIKTDTLTVTPFWGKATYGVKFINGSLYSASLENMIIKYPDMDITNPQVYLTGSVKPNELFYSGGKIFTTDWKENAKFYEVSFPDEYVANGINSFSFGRGAFSGGNLGVAIGFDAQNYNEYGLSLGAYSLTQGDMSSSIGYNTKTTGRHAMTIGMGTKVGTLDVPVVNDVDDTILIVTSDTNNGLSQNHIRFDTNIGMTFYSDVNSEGIITATNFYKGEYPLMSNVEVAELYVPYTGATQDVDLGNNSLTAGSYVVDRINGFVSLNTNLNIIAGRDTGESTDIIFQNSYSSSSNIERMRIKDDGKIGIGTDAPTAQVEIVASSNISPLRISGAYNQAATIKAQSTIATGYSGMNMYDESGVLSGSFQYGNTSAGSFTNEFVIASRKSTTALKFYQGGANTANERIRIDASGNIALLNAKIGVGTTAPATLFEIGSSDLGNGVAGPVITLGRNTNATNTGAGSINFLSKGGTAGFVWQDAAGNIRINTSAPSNANDTAGTVVGAQTSTRETKQDINDYTDYSNALSMIVNAPLHTFRYVKEVNGYGSESPLAKERIGFIADEVDPVFMVGNSIDQVSINGILMAAIKEMDLKVKNLELNGPSTFGEYANIFFSEIVTNVESGVLYMKGLVVESIKVGSPEKRTGITLYDEVTGEPYCLSIADGNTKTVAGECGIITSPEPVGNSGGEENIGGEVQVDETEGDLIVDDQTEIVETTDIKVTENVTEIKNTNTQTPVENTNDKAVEPSSESSL